MKVNGHRRIFISLIIMSLLILLISGCKGDITENYETTVSSDQDVSPKQEANRIHIQFAQMSVPSAKFVEEAINQFNETNPEHIYVDLLKIPRDRYIDTLNMLNASGKGPDVFEVSKEWLNSYIYKEWLADLSSFVGDAFFAAFPQWAVDFAKNPLYNNSFYTIPSSQITYRLIYNKEMFRNVGLNPDEPPKTLSELASFAARISDAGKGERKYGFALPMGEELGGLVQPMEASNSYSGIYYYNFKTGIYDLRVYKPWLETFKALKENGGLFPGMSSMKDDLATAQFAEGNIGMMYAASWKLSLFSEQYPPINEWGVAMPPAIDESSIGKGAITISAAGLNVIKRGTQHLKEAVKVWQFLYSKDYLGHLYKSGSVIPVMNGIIENPSYTPTVVNFNAFLPSSKDSIYPNTPLIMDEWSRSKAYVSGISGEQALDKVLLEENIRLNTLLNTQFSTFVINKNDYYFPSFDPLHPLRK